MPLRGLEPPRLSAHDPKEDEFALAIYEGIDFANRDHHFGRCRVVDKRGVLRLELEFDEEAPIKKTAVDRPFGSSWGFQELLNGNIVPDVEDDGYKARKTELWLREHIREYETNIRWGDRNDAEREEFPRQNYFNGGAHVQSTLALQIVPDCLAWLFEKLGEFDNPAARLQALSQARRGESDFVEAHPRLFLYSIIERLYLYNEELITLQVLNTVAGYKDRDGEPPHTERRAAIYRLLCQNHEGWLPVGREIRPHEAPASLVESDHTFDAWLCCLTAWAHDLDQTIGWQAVEIEQQYVDVEGHIHILPLGPRD